MPSFDIVSKTDLAEVDNAINGVKREVENRYDFKGSKIELTHKDGEITLLADDDYKLRTVQDMLKANFVRRQLDPVALDFQKEEGASGGAKRQLIKVKQGLDQESAKKIVKHIKDAKMKVQVSIRGDEVRVDSKKRDDLQEAIAGVKAMGLPLPLQFINFRD